MLQTLTGLLTLRGAFLKVPPEHQPLVDILKLETAVQFVEAGFYAWALKSAVELKTLAARRYTDWVFTTPTMLVATIMYMNYLDGTPGIKEHKKDIMEILVYNLGMLVFGYLGEINVLPKKVSISLGFACFAKSFHLIYKKFNNKKSEKIFNFLLVVWGLYGIAAMFPDVQKNVSYNLLDVVAKNFYGLYIYYKVYDISSVQTRGNNIKHN
jgi:bacteriorhodopsin